MPQTRPCNLHAIKTSRALKPCERACGPCIHRACLALVRLQSAATIPARRDGREKTSCEWEMNGHAYRAGQGTPDLRSQSKNRWRRPDGPANALPTQGTRFAPPCGVSCMHHRHCVYMHHRHCIRPRFDSVEYVKFHDSALPLVPLFLSSHICRHESH